MAKVTFILGLAGAGKSYKAEAMHVEDTFDGEDFFYNAKGQQCDMIEALNQGRDCVVIDVAYNQEAGRHKIASLISAKTHHTEVEWICFENDLEKCNRNCRERPAKEGDPTGNNHVRMNFGLHPVYEYPAGAEPVAVWTSEQGKFTL